MACFPLEQRLGIVGPALEFVPRLEHRRLRRLQHRVQPPQDQQREDDAAVLRRAVVTADQVRDLPDEMDLAVEALHGLTVSVCEVASGRLGRARHRLAAGLPSVSP
jgi:hypothetical protein